MLRIALLYCLFSFSLHSHAETETYNRIDFQVEAAREISNDLLVAQMNVEIQDRQPALVAQRLNTTLNEALKQAASFGTVKTSSGNQNTYPVYDKNNQVSAWRGQARIRLESRDFKAAGELIMALQEKMQLGELQFTLSPDARLKIEDELISTAIKAFQNRADAIRIASGAKSYKMVHFSINSGNHAQPYPFAEGRSLMLSKSAIPAPDFSGGESRMTVQINGTIELQ